MDNAEGEGSGEREDVRRPKSIFTVLDKRLDASPSTGCLADNGVGQKGSGTKGRGELRRGEKG